jgi:hypothetical protein
MRILLDAHDLIDLTERGRPITVEEFGVLLRRGGHQNVLSFTNVRELSGPLAQGGNFEDIRPILQSLEAMPLQYIQEVGIPRAELTAAVHAFNGGQEYPACNINVPRWDETLLTPPNQPAPAYNLENLRLDQVVWLIYQGNTGVFAPPNRHLPQLQQILQEDRVRLKNGEAPAREHFIRAIQRHANRHGVRLPQGREREFAGWVYRNPDRCPGLRINHETYRGLMANHGDVPTASDFSDLAHVMAVPYVDAATFDNRMRHYATAAAKKMIRFGATTDLRERLLPNLAAIVEELGGCQRLPDDERK